MIAAHATYDPRMWYRNVHSVFGAVSPEVAAALVESILRFQQGIDLVALEAAIVGGNLSVIEGAAGAGRLSILLAANEKLYRLLHDAQTLAGTQAAAILSDFLGLKAGFNISDPAAVLYARTQVGELIVAVGDDVKEAVRIITAVGQDVGLTYTQQARAIRHSIGLPPNWVQAPLNFRQELVAGRLNSSRLLHNPRTWTGRKEKAQESAVRQLKTGLDAGRYTDPAWVDGWVDRYRENLLNRRALNIARTETMRAANHGQRSSWTQNKRNGILPPTARRVWIVTPDDRLRPDHASVPGMNPDGVALDGGVYETPLGSSDGPPLEPLCRCVEGLIFPELADLRTGLFDD